MTSALGTPSTGSCADRQRRIASRFSRAAASYDAAASLQREVADELMARLPAIEPPRTLVDVGCGTGYLISGLVSRPSPRLSTGPDARAIGLDIAPGMLAEARRRHASLPIDWLTGCAEQLPLADNSVDLIVSSLAVQWCDSLSRFLNEAARVLRPGGWLAFTTLCQGTLRELQQATRQVDGQRRGNAFVAETALIEALDAPVWRLHDLQLTTRKTFHATPVDALRALKQIGASTLTEASTTAGLAGRRRLIELTNALEAQREPSGIPTRYRIATVLLERREYPE